MKIDKSIILSPDGVKSTDLIPGRVYIQILYADDECCMPIIESMVFLGRNIEGNGNGEFYFQDIESYTDVGAFPEVSDERTRLTIVDEKMPPNIFEIAGAVDELSRCATRQKSRQSWS